MAHTNNPPRICRGGGALGKRRRLFLALKFTFGVVLLGALIGALLYFRIPPAQTALSKYKQANICLEQKNCRSIIAGYVVESKTLNFSIRVSAGRTSSRTITKTQYEITVNLEDGQQKKTVILPDIPLSRELFGYNAYIPELWLEKSFPEDYFPVGEPIRVEIWQDEIVSLYTRDVHNIVFGSPNGLILVYPATGPNGVSGSTRLDASQKSVEEILIPTSSHPLIVLFTAQEDFNSIIYGFGFIALVIFILTISTKW
jgi:hypothetical protein